MQEGDILGRRKCSTQEHRHCLSADTSEQPLTVQAAGSQLPAVGSGIAYNCRGIRLHHEDRHQERGLQWPALVLLAAATAGARCRPGACTKACVAVGHGSTARAVLNAG